MNPSFERLVGLAGALALAFSLGRTTAPGTSVAQSDAPPTSQHVVAPEAPEVQNGSAFTYRGQLRKNGAPVNGSCNASFRLYDAPGGGVQLGGTVTSATLQVVGGLFTIPLDFGWNLNGEARWLETAVGCGEAQSTLAPRTALRPVPYAFALPGLRTVPGISDFAGQPTMNVIGGVVSGTISNTISAESYNSVVAGGYQNGIATNSEFSAISGGYQNRIHNSSVGVIAGGQQNRIITTSSYSAIGGGEYNWIGNSYRSTIGGGGQNQIDNNSYYGTIGGGWQNDIDNNSSRSAIGGGYQNNINNNSFQSAIAGGGTNRIDNFSDSSAIGGGFGNVITSAQYAAIPGGTDNRVEGDYGFAAGRRAKSLHNGAFVWGDSTDASVSSTGNNQFVVRATGGLRLIGSGLNSTTSPALVHQAAPCAVAGLGVNRTAINHPLANGNPNAILVVTPNYGDIIGGSAPPSNPVGVYYDSNGAGGCPAGRWVIYDLASPTAWNANMRFNVLIINP